MAVADKVKSIIVEQLGVDEEEVTPDASFVDDLGRRLARHGGAGDGVRGGVRDRDSGRGRREDHARQGSGRVHRVAQQRRSSASCRQAAAGRRSFEQASRRDRRRPGVAARHRHRGELGGALRRAERHRSDHQVRRVAVLRADRGRGQGLRPAAVHREERRQEDGRLHPVRHRRRRSSRWTTRGWR